MHSRKLIKKWQIKDFIWIITINVTVLFVVSYIINKFRPLIPLEFQPTPSLSILLKFILQTIILLAPLYFFTIHKYQNNLTDFGFKLKVKNITRIIKSVIGSYFFYVIFSLTIISTFSSFGMEKIPGFEQQEPFLPLLGPDKFSLSLAFLIVVILAPISEEIFFRGYLLQLFSSKIKPVWSSLLTACIFAAVHFQFQSIVPLFILALLLNRLFLKFDSIWPGVFFHMINNGLALFAEYYLLAHPEIFS